MNLIIYILNHFMCVCLLEFVFPVLFLIVIVIHHNSKAAELCKEKEYCPPLPF